MEIEIIVKIDGKEVTTMKKTVELTEDKSHPEVSENARFFDEANPNWTKDAEYNLRFIKVQQIYANDLLKSRGHLFLNEVYDMLGLPRSKAGAVLGWIYDKDNPTGDNYVDFGLYDLDKERNRNFVNGYEKTVLLDFNVDGNIIERAFK